MNVSQKISRKLDHIYLMEICYMLTCPIWTNTLFSCTIKLLAPPVFDGVENLL